MNNYKNLKNNDYISCPVCEQDVMLYDICDNCGWENTGAENIDGGPNELTLQEAKTAYKKIKEK